MTAMGEGLEALRDGLSGTAAVCERGDVGYDEAVLIWNAAITRRPSVVVRCTSPKLRDV
jgi:hypothetical protein